MLTGNTRKSELLGYEFKGFMPVKSLKGGMTLGKDLNFFSYHSAYSLIHHTKMFLLFEKKRI